MVDSKANNWRHLHSNFAHEYAHVNISFIVPCFNGRVYLEECLWSIARLAQPDWEVLVVDDGSTEDIREVVNQFSPLARYLRQANAGPSAARNNGLRNVSGQYVRFLDADDYLLSAEGLREQVALLDAHPEVGLVYAQSLKVDTEGRQIAVRKAPRATGSYVRSGEEELEDLLLGNYITTSSVIVRRSVLEKVSGFRPDLRSGEDWELWLRIAQVSSIGYVAKPVVAYRIHTDSTTAHYRVEPWLRIHEDILHGFFANPATSQRYAALREAAYARMYAGAAILAYTSAQSRLARKYAWKALTDDITSRQWMHAAECALLIAKSWIPTTIRQSLRQMRIRCRMALMMLRFALRQA